MHYFFVQLIIAELALSCREKELVGSGESKEQSSFLTVRATARNDPAQIGHYLVTDATAMAASGIGLGAPRMRTYRLHRLALTANSSTPFHDAFTGCHSPMPARKFLKQGVADRVEI